jgi:hypothetical protein
MMERGILCTNSNLVLSAPFLGIVRLVNWRMARSLTKKTGRQVGVGLGVLCFFCLMPGYAGASCGNHVRLSGDGHIDRAEPLPRNAAPERSRELPRPQSPCFGPNCSSAPAPLPAPPSGGPQGSMQWALWSVSSSLANSPASAQIELDSAFYSFQFLCPPDPPPRRHLLSRS